MLWFNLLNLQLSRFMGGEDGAESMKTNLIYWKRLPGMIKMQRKILQRSSRSHSWWGGSLLFSPQKPHPRYLADYCVPVSEVPGRQRLRSARCHQLSVPRVRRSTFGTRAFSVAGPTVWNSLPDHLRDPAVDYEQFRPDLKRYLFAGHWKR